MPDAPATVGDRRSRRVLLNLAPYAALFLAAGYGAILFSTSIPWWSLFFLAATFVWIVIRVVFAVRHGKAPTASSRKEKILLGVVMIGMMPIPLLYVGTPLLGFADVDLPYLIHWLGAAVMVAGIIVFAQSHAALGRQWSPSLELIDEHALVVTGPYRHVRHPMYTAIFLITLAQALLLDNWVAGPSGLLAFAVLYLLRVDDEEAMMEAHFGTTWTEYAARTPRLLPRLRGTADSGVA